MSATVKYQVRQARGERELERRSSCGMTCSASSRACPSTRSSTGGTATGSIWSRSRAMTARSATCRLLLVGRTVQFSRLAVRADARRRGIATAMLEVADAEARAAGARRLVLHAQTYARALYENAGYRPRGSRVPRGGDRAHRDGEGACLKYGSTRSPGSGRSSRETGRASRRRLSARACAEARPGKATRSPRATRTGPRPSSTRSGRAAAPRTRRGGPSGSCPNLYPALSADAPSRRSATRTRTCSGRLRRAGTTR